MKKILVILLSVLITLTACTSSPKKIVIYAKTSAGTVNLLSIEVGASASATTIVENYPMWWFFADPGGRSIVIFSENQGSANNADVEAVLRVIDTKGNFKDLVVPQDIISSVKSPNSFNVSFDQSGIAYLELYFYDTETDSALFEVYKIQEDRFIQTAEASFDRGVSFVYYNGGLAYRNKIVLIPDVNTEDKWVKLYDMATGTIVTISPQLGDYPDIPIWSPDTQKYAYSSLYDENTVCWVYNNGLSDQKLICLPSNWRHGTGAAAPNWKDVAWSPDGRYIAVAIPDADQNNESLYVFNITGTPRTVFTTIIPGFITNLVWSPDSTLLGFSNWDQKQGGIYTLDLHNNLTEVYKLIGLQYPSGGIDDPIHLVGWLK
jgi:hypothetical protein